MREPSKFDRLVFRMLTQLFENFKINYGESTDSLFSRFADIVNPLKSLGNELLPMKIK